MQLPSASRPTRVRRLLAISAAAVAVMIAPTACDYGGYGSGASHDTGDLPGMDGKSPNQNPVIVPVGNIKTTEPAAGEATSTATQSARQRRFRHRGRGHGGQTTTPVATSTEAAVPIGTTTTDTAVPPPTDTTTAAPTTAPAAGIGSVGPGGKDGNNNGLTLLGRDCTQSALPAHNGFQESPACVSTQMGEVAAKDKLPSLLIVDAPTAVGVGVDFTLKISTRNLVRDRFLGAKAGGYYLESSFLVDDPNDKNFGLQRGHFHTACRILPSITEAPDSSPDPEFFLATEDGKGDGTPDVVTINVPAANNKAPGNLQCTSWAGDGSHRTPMMTQANETPAIDSVRITVTNDSAPPTGYRQTAGNDPAAAQADLAAQADAKQDAAGQAPDADKNGTTDTGKGVTASGPPASEVAAATATPAPAGTAAPADSAPADTASETPAAEAPASN